MGMESKTLRVGFLPLNDCAPIVIARELGLFEQHGLSVELHREKDWACIRDKVAGGELDAAQAPMALPLAINCGIASEPRPCVTGLVLSLHGNAITISRSLWESGVYDAQTLRKAVTEAAGRKTFTLAVPFLYSSHNFILRQWVISGGIDPDVELRIVVVPPREMFPHLSLGYIDGYCVGEPWGGLAVQAKAGVCIATSAEIAPLHPDKVLMVREDFAEERADEHERLIAALIQACAFCDKPQNRRAISDCLAQPQYVDAPQDCIRAGLTGPFIMGNGCIRSSSDFHIFHRANANEPGYDKAQWTIGQMDALLDAGDHGGRGRPLLGAGTVFRPDIYERALQRVAHEARKIEEEAARV
jgi:two-component system, oxyanion-binding sensor